MIRQARPFVHSGRTPRCRSLKKGMATEDARPNKLRQGFVSLAEALIRSVAEVFPECEATEAALTLYTTILKGDEQREDAFVRQCGTLFRTHAEPLKRREEAGLFAVADSLPLLKDIDLRAKWADPGFTQDSKDNMWQYLHSLKTYADLYCALPGAVMGKLERVAGDIGERLRCGELDIGSLNVAELGNELLGQLSPEEIRSFEGNLPEIYKSITDVAAAVAGQMGCGGMDVEALMKSVVQSQGKDGAGGPDAADLMQRVGALLAPGSGLGAPAGLPPGALQGMMSMLGGAGAGAGPGGLNLSPDSLRTLLSGMGAKDPKDPKDVKNRSAVEDRKPSKVRQLSRQQ